MRLEFEWPDESAERVRAAIGRLTNTAQELRALTLEERLGAVRDVLFDWISADSPWRRELAQTLPGVSGFHEGTLTEGLDSALRAWDADRFVACAHAELALTRTHSIDTEASRRRRLVPFDWTTVWAGGSIPMPTILSSLLPLVLGSPVLLRETRKDPVTAGILARSLLNRSEVLARSFEAVAFAPEDLAATKAALQAPCVVATGSDETIDAIANQLTPSQRLVAYGHRFSIAVIGPDLDTGEDRVREIARGLALDTARWDQLGCLSPIVVYLVGIDARTRTELAAQISEQLSHLAIAMPRGELGDAIAVDHATERAEARMRAAMGTTKLFEAPSHTVVLEADARARPAPLHRFLRLMPVAGLNALNETLEPFAGHLSSAGLAGFPRGAVGDVNPGRNRGPNRSDHAPRRSEVIETLERLGVCRIAPPGSLQTPPIDWPHDGRPIFEPLARFGQVAD